MNPGKKLLISTLLLFPLSGYTQAQDDFMRQTGKIHVVYAVLTVIFTGFFIFLFFLERRIKKIENKLDNEQ